MRRPTWLHPCETSAERGSSGRLTSWFGSSPAMGSAVQTAIAPGSTGRGNPLLSVLIFAAAMGCVDPNPRTVRHSQVAGADAKLAESALRRYGCIDCHIVPGIRGATGLVGPPLNRFSERRYVAGRLPNEVDHLVTFIVNPQAVKPGSAMPATGISSQEARHVAAYLHNLR